MPFGFDKISQIEREFILKGLIFFLLSFNLFAALEKAPPSFSHLNSQIVFMDITDIKAEIEYQLSKNQALATSEIEFEIKQAGKPAFDLVSEVISAHINGRPVEISEVSAPDNATVYKFINLNLPVGPHKLEIKNKVTTNLRFNSNSVEQAFWMSDLTDRRYLERYLPCNMEFDQYPLELTVKFDRVKIDRHDLFTNGFVKETSPNTYQIKFPDYFTSSSFYFHMVKKDKFKTSRTHFKSVDGRRVPLTIYSRNSFNVRRAEKQTREILVELEDIFGAWAHPSLTIYVAGSGGMEYSGATMTSLRALGHELIHSYFARGVMPVRGNSGWIDEAIASWRDDGYNSRKTPGFRSTSMGAHSVYRRFTDRQAYSQGADFMEYLNYRLSAQGGLKSFLKDVYKSHVHQTITTKNLQNLLKSYSGIDFSQDFKQYILGNQSKQEHKHNASNPFHPKLTKQEELDLL